MKKSKRLPAIGHSLLKIVVSALAVTSIATTILAQPANSPDAPTNPSVTIAPQSSDTNWGVIAAIVTGVGGIIATILQSRNSSMSLQITSLEKQQQSIADEREKLRQQTFDQIASLKAELAEEKSYRKELTTQLDKLEDESAKLTRENMRLEAKCSMQEVEIASLRTQLVDILPRFENGGF